MPSRPAKAAGLCPTRSPPEATHTLNDSHGMRIVHVLHSHGYGGAESHALLMMRLQREAGHEVWYAGPMDSWLGHACQEAGIHCEHLPMHGLFDLWSHWKLRRLLRRVHADIVHGHLIRGAMYAGHAGHMSRRPVAICTAHATTARTHMQRCAQIIAVSEAVASGLQAGGYRPDRIQLIYNGVPDAPPVPSAAERAALRSELGISEDTFAVVHVGRFVHDKGQDLLVNAMASTPEEMHLYLLGDAETEFGHTVRRLCDTLPTLRSRVHFMGYRNDVQRLLPAFDGFALPSRREALSIAVIEAFAARVPVAAARVGGVPEIVLHERTGLLVEPDDPQALSQALVRLHQTPELASGLIDRAEHLYRTRLTAAGMLQHTLALYQRCLAPHAPVSVAKT